MANWIKKAFKTYANEAFEKTANYETDKLIGHPHNIIRHPDMPRITFKGLLQDFVKNARRGGGFYWIHATVLRKIDTNGKIHHISIRTKPTRDAIKEQMYFIKL